MKRRHYPIEDYSARPIRSAQPGDRWEARFNPIKRNWYAKPLKIGVWATSSSALLEFTTWRAAFAHAYKKATQR